MAVKSMMLLLLSGCVLLMNWRAKSTSIVIRRVVDREKKFLSADGRLLVRQTIFIN